LAHKTIAITGIPHRPRDQIKTASPAQGIKKTSSIFKLINGTIAGSYSGSELN
jgi:NAD-dependent DNA ligase